MDQSNENCTSSSSSRRGVHDAVLASKEHHVESSRSSNEGQNEYSSPKRARLTETEPSRPVLGVGDKGLRRENSIAGGQTSGVPVKAGKDFSSSVDNNTINRLQIVPVSTKANGRKAEVEIANQNALIPHEVNGTARIEERPHFRDQHEGIEPTLLGKSAHLQATVARATDTLQNAYAKLYKKYQQLKARQIVDAEATLAEQSRRMEVFSTAADDLVQNWRTASSLWQDQDDMTSRTKKMEAAYIECQNDLVIERAKNLELRQELERIELHGSELLHELLQNVTQLTVSGCGKSHIVFSHPESGFEFKLERNKLSEEVGGKNALLYKSLAPGTLLHCAPEWMHSEIVFDQLQSRVFFRRLSAVIFGCVT